MRYPRRSIHRFAASMGVAIVVAFSPAMVRATPLVDVSPAELAQYTQLYQLPIPNTFNFNSTSGIAGVPYSVDNTADIAVGSFTRVAYYFELQPTSGSSTWVWVSMDTPNTNPAMLGVPNSGTGILYNNGTTVNNLHVESNSALITQGDFAGAAGVLEFWASNYNQNGGGVLGSNNSYFDWGDGGGGTGGGHGSMQVFNIASGLATPQTLFGFNGLNQSGHMGIGNQSTPGTGDIDWTFGPAANTFTIKNLEVWVNPPPPATLTWDGLGNGNWTDSRWTGSPPRSRM